MKTIFAAIGAFALATAATGAALADGDGGKAQKEFYAVARGDYSLGAAARPDIRQAPAVATSLRSTAPSDVANARKRAAEADRR